MHGGCHIVEDCQGAEHLAWESLSQQGCEALHGSREGVTALPQTEEWALTEGPRKECTTT